MRAITTPRLIQDIKAQPQSLSDVFEHQSGAGHDALLSAAELLLSAKRVILTGIGASMFASVVLEYRLCSYGIPAFLIEAAELLHYRHEVCADSVAQIGAFRYTPQVTRDENNFAI